MFYGRKLVNEEYQEIQFMWNNNLQTMRIQMSHDERKKLIFKISATVPRFEMEEISIKESDDPDIKEIKYTEIPGGFGDVGIRVFESDHPIHDIVRIIYLYFEV